MKTVRHVHRHDHYSGKDRKEDAENTFKLLIIAGVAIAVVFNKFFLR